MHIRNKHIYILATLMLLGIIFMIINGIRKEGLFFVDDQWSFSYANSKEILRFYDLPDTWITAKDLKYYVTVQPNQRFSYDIPYYNSITDAHPPLFYILLHTVCSFFPNTISKWYDLSINIVFYALTIGAIYALSNCMFRSKNQALIAAAIWAFSTGAVSSVII